MSTKQIFTNFKLTDEEFSDLYERYNKLCKFQSWGLLKKNSKNNLTEEQEDIEQELLLSLLHAGVYYKRQVYIESCLELVKEYATDEFYLEIIDKLCDLWDSRRCHGANKQRFGEAQERILDFLVSELVPEYKKPDKTKRLIVDKKFNSYCKGITWNKVRTLGKKISKERVIRQGMTSLGEYEYLAAG